MGSLDELGVAESETPAEERTAFFAEPAAGGHRGRWASHREFLMTTLGLTIGLGNVWRFPWLVYAHGAVFWLVYVLLLVVVGLPIFALEALLGQFSSRGPLVVFRRVIPLLEGVGLVSMFYLFMNVFLYGNLFTYCLFYAFNTFESPWKECMPGEPGTKPWERRNSPSCFTIHDYRDCIGDHGPSERYYAKGRCYSNDNINDFIDETEDCIMSYGDRWYRNPDDPESWRCQFHMRFFFNASRYYEFFDLPKEIPARIGVPCKDLARKYREFLEMKSSYDATAIWGQKDDDELEEEFDFFERYHKCNKSLDAPVWEDWSKPPHWSMQRKHEVEDYRLILNHRADSQRMARRAQARADCLAMMISASQPNHGVCMRELADLKSARLKKEDQVVLPDLAEPMKPMSLLACSVMRYCLKTWPKEKLTNVDCIRRIVNSQESYASEEFFYSFIGQNFVGIDGLSWSYEVVLCSALAWTLIATAVYKGPKFLSKITYFTVSVPCILVLVLTFTIFHPTFFASATTGLRYYTDFSELGCKLARYELWMDALSQVFYSLSLSIGAIITLSSLNEFHKDFFQDSIIIVTVDTLFSLLSGLGIFVIIGYMADQVNTDIGELLQSPTSIIFVVLTQATAELPGGEIMAFAYFGMMCLLSVDTASVTSVAFLRTMADEMPFLRRHRFLVTATTATALFCASIFFTSRSSMNLINILDHSVFAVGIPFLSLLELGLLCLCYGPLNLFYDIRLMLGKAGPVGRNMSDGWCRYYPLVSWSVLAPLVTATILSASAYYTWQSIWTMEVDNRSQFISGLVLGPLLILTASVLILTDFRCSYDS